MSITLPIFGGFVVLPPVDVVSHAQQTVHTTAYISSLSLRFVSYYENCVFFFSRSQSYTQWLLFHPSPLVFGSPNHSYQYASEANSKVTVTKLLAPTPWRKHQVSCVGHRARPPLQTSSLYTSDPTLAGRHELPQSPFIVQFENYQLPLSQSQDSPVWQQQAHARAGVEFIILSFAAFHRADHEGPQGFYASSGYHTVFQKKCDFIAGDTQFRRLYESWSTSNTYR